MTDPRWQKAMERLGLWVVHDCVSTSFPAEFGKCVLQPDPDDPATFLRVVEALNKLGYGVSFSAWHGEVVVGSMRSRPTLYEAVMEAFGA